MRRLYLLRHGHTVGGDELRYKGHTDVPLSEKGRGQIEALADYLKREGVNGPAVYSSDLKRAAETAEIISEALGVPVVKKTLLRERNFGLWEGMSLEEIEQRYPREFEKWRNNPLRYKPPEGESTLDVRDRVKRAVEEILEEVTQGDIVVVSHGGVNRVLLCHLLDIPLENIFRIEQDYGCLNLIELHHNGSGQPGSLDALWPVVRRLNLVPYDGVLR